MGDCLIKKWWIFIFASESVSLYSNSHLWTFGFTSFIDVSFKDGLKMPKSATVLIFFRHSKSSFSKALLRYNTACGCIISFCLVQVWTKKLDLKGSSKEAEAWILQTMCLSKTTCYKFDQSLSITVDRKFRSEIALLVGICSLIRWLSLCFSVTFQSWKKCSCIRFA